MNKFQLECAMAILGGLLAACEPVCENEVSQTVPSPNGGWKAVTFHRGCGATMGINTQLSIIASDVPLSNDGGNVLILKDDVPLKIKWLSEGKLLISGAQHGEAFKREAERSGVVISYE